MSRKRAPKAAETASLVRAVPDSPSFPGLELVGRKLERGLSDVFAGLTGAAVGVSAVAVRTDRGTLPAGFEVRQLRLAPLKGRMALAMEREAIARLVDLYYGGEGSGVGPAETLSAAGRRLFERVTQAVCGLLPAAWYAFGTIAADIDEEAGPDDGSSVVLEFSVGLAGGAPVTLQFRFPLAMLEPVDRLKSAGAEADPAIADQDWDSRLVASALGVPFAVRAVFAEPMLPLSRLAALRPGDVIPVCLPGEIGLFIAGRRVALGQAGEANGRAAISIDQI